MSIHPQIIEKEGKKEYVVLPYEEFLVIKELLEDFEDSDAEAYACVAATCIAS